MQNLDEPEFQWQQCMLIAADNARKEYADLPIEKIISESNRITEIIFSDLALNEDLVAEDYIVRMTTLNLFKDLLSEKYFIVPAVKESLVRTFICIYLIDALVNIRQIQDFYNDSNEYDIVENFRAAVSLFDLHPDLFGESTESIFNILYLEISAKLGANKHGHEIDVIYLTARNKTFAEIFQVE